MRTDKNAEGAVKRLRELERIEVQSVTFGPVGK
jgi:hypothetical protein